MPDHRTTAAIQQHLNALAEMDGRSPVEPIVHDLLARSVARLHLLCGSLLHRSYRRLTRGPVNLEADEVLSAVVERLIKALRQVRPTTVRQFFALANQHMRWELNDVARRLDERAAAVELRESLVGPRPPAGDDGPDGGSVADPGVGRVLAAIEALPEDEREAFTLVRIQGLTQPEAAAVVGCSERTLQRRLSRSLVFLTTRLGDVRDQPRPAAVPA